MINPKNRKATTRCRIGCNTTNICAPCRNFRKSFKVGQIITWGICSQGFKIETINKSSVSVCIDGRKSAVSFKELNLKLARRCGWL